MIGAGESVVHLESTIGEHVSGRREHDDVDLLLHHVERVDQTLISTVAAELRHGREIVVGHNAVESIMRELGLKGLPTRRLPRGARMAKVMSLDLVGRVFARSGPNQLWLTDIAEHPTREGRLYCCVVFDAFSRMVVGWAVDSALTTRLVPQGPQRSRSIADLVRCVSAVPEFALPGRDAEASSMHADRRRGAAQFACGATAVRRGEARFRGSLGTARAPEARDPGG